MSPPRTTVLAVLGTVILQLAAARDALKVAAVQPERGAKVIPDRSSHCEFLTCIFGSLHPDPM